MDCRRRSSACLACENVREQAIVLDDLGGELMSARMAVIDLEDGATYHRSLSLGYQPRAATPRLSQRRPETISTPSNVAWGH